MIAVVDYGMGNLLSVSKALEFVGASPAMASTPDQIRKSSALVLPGVGNFGDGMRNLMSLGLVEPLKEQILEGKPFLGICLGMQLLMEESEEAPGLRGIGIFKGRVARFQEGNFKVPHMGWNQLRISRYNQYLLDIPNMSHFYFVHSYYVVPEDPEIVVGTCDYACEFSAAIGRDSVFATQFHPEKSQEKGLQILRNFTRIAYAKSV